MKYLYFDLVGGISGDMIAASLLDITRGFEYLREELKKIDLDKYTLELSQCQSGHISAHRFIVCDIAKEKRVFQLDSIKSKIKDSYLKENTKQKIIGVYETLYKAEREIHGSDHVHFEQIGEVDSLMDIASACILIEKFGVEKILYSRIPFGEKIAPATALLLKTQNVYLSKHRFENITPTGAAIITALGKQVDLDARHNFSIEEVGYGIGSIEAENLQNVLRVVVFKECESFELKGAYNKHELTF